VSILQPAIVLLLFRDVLGGAIHVPGIDSRVSQRCRRVPVKPFLGDKMLPWSSPSQEAQFPGPGDCLAA
jgi:hypothetical protein